MHMRPLALPLLLIPGAASADVTPKDVWDNMVAGYGSVGLELTATIDDGGDTLSANEGVVTFTYPVIGGSATISMPPMTFLANGDGTVSIQTPGTYVSAIVADIPEEAEQVSMDMTIATQGFSSVASGNPGDVTYTTSTSSLDLLISNLAIPGEEDITFNLQFDSDGYDSLTQVTVAEDVSITNETTNRASVTTFDIDSEGLRQESKTSSGELVTTLAMVMPMDADILNLGPALRAGLSITGTSAGVGGETTTKTYDGDQLFSEQTQITGASTANFGFDAESLRIDGASEGGSFTMTADEFGLPVPIEVSFGAATSKLALPLLASEEPQTTVFGFNLTDLTIADGLWDLFDFNKALDRSPVTLSIDLSADVISSKDLVDPATWAAMDQGDVPFEPVSLTLNGLGLGALGAVIQANGAFTFDNTDLATFGGFPRPEGTATASAKGLNAAIDQLIGAGFISDGDVAMPRMFMGMFAVSQGDDDLTTELEINSEGHVILNGQRVQ